MYVSNALAPDMAAYVEVHKSGYFWIETPIDPAVVAHGPDPGTPEANSPTGIRRVEATARWNFASGTPMYLRESFSCRP
ncbi:hypothetical protein [Bradyrhizobium retamae]|uniref:hypothetical protein n=1 Tax=Bradyrhizobium retamae TaxID=1300035 RepID=UPI000AEA0792|nr:hypothetical protein [Bradyrhizobium retamae]